MVGIRGRLERLESRSGGVVIHHKSIDETLAWIAEALASDIENPNIQSTTPTGRWIREILEEDQL